MIMENNIATYPVGGGIVWDSDPIEEWKEAPVWDEDSIASATQSWFKYLSD